MKSKDPNYAIKVEQAITKKYGEETVQHPKKGWNDEKEKEYLEDLKGFYKYEESGMNEEQEINGVFIPNKLITKNLNVLVLYVMFIPLNQMMMFICQNLIVVKNATFNI